MCLNSSWRRVFLVTIFLSSSGTGIATDEPAKERAPEAPKPLPEDVVAAWTKAGATAAWMRHTSLGHWTMVGDKQSRPGDIPAFRFAAWKDGVIA